jgi:hypothetical protein
MAKHSYSYSIARGYTMRATVKHNGKTLKIYLGKPEDHGLTDEHQDDDGVSLLFVDSKQAFIDSQVIFLNSGNRYDYSAIPALLRKQAE